MPILHVENVAQLGIVKDIPEWELPANAWTDGNNVRFIDNLVEKAKGREQVFGTLSGAPYFIMPVQKAANYFWFYASLTNIYGIDGTTHYDITKTATTYNASADLNWTGGTLSGGVVVLNNGSDVPQAWTGSALTDLFVDLANWPGSMTARVLRPFKNFLVAADIDEGSGRINNLLRWSHPADPGGVPASWDYTDPTYDAGRTPIDTRGENIVDMHELRDVMMIYKENSTSMMQFTGGHNIFTFRDVFEQLGVLSRRCVAPFFGKHFVFATDDVVVHDGHNVNQILTKRWKRWLFSTLDDDNYERSFVVVNYKLNEVWLCFPQQGSTFPDTALIYNWRDNTVYPRDLPTQTGHIAWGIVNSQVSSSFDDDTGTFDTAAGLFDDQTYSGVSRDLLVGDIANSKLFLQDSTYQDDGSNMTCYVERDYLPLLYRGHVDTERVKFVRQVQPRITGTDGGVVNVYVGYRNHIDDPITWEGPHAYTINSSRKVDVRVSGRYISIKFESTTDIEWNMSGYSLEYEVGGIR